MGVIQQVADMMIGALSEGTVLNKMPGLPTGKASLKDPVKVCISRDQLDPPVEGIAREFHPRVREEFDIVTTLEAHSGGG